MFRWEYLEQDFCRIVQSFANFVLPRYSIIGLIYVHAATKIRYAVKFSYQLIEQSREEETRIEE